MNRRIELPKEVQPYRDLISDHGGNEPEELLWRLEHEKNLTHTNIVVFSLAIMVQAQVSLIHRMVLKGILK